MRSWAKAMSPAAAIFQLRKYTVISNETASRKMTRARSACSLTEAPHEGPMNVPLTSDSATPNALARSVRTFWLSVSESSRSAPAPCCCRRG